MNTLLEEVTQRTNLALSNQMEMLTFYLTDKQLYGINVFKIIEIIEGTRPVIKLPKAHPHVAGAVNFRGSATTVIDLSAALGLEPLAYLNQLCYIIVCEYSNRITGFMIKQPESLLTRGWEEIRKPAGMLTSSAALVAIAYSDSNQTIQLLDIEKILIDVLGMEDELSADLQVAQVSEPRRHHVLVADDSKTARQMIQSVLDQLGISATLFDSAPAALGYLAEHDPATISLVISDIEMPDMDGFTFTRTIRQDPRLSGLYVMLHSSMSNASNKLKAEQVQADAFLGKFKANELAVKVMERLKAIDDGTASQRKAA